MIIKQLKTLLITSILVAFSQNLLAEITPLSQLDEQKLTSEEQLGAKIFFDTNLSIPAGIACATCHDIKTSFTDNIQTSPVSLGSVLGRTGTRNTPMVTYSSFSPTFNFDSEIGGFVGGQFLDGRAVDLKEQAKAPFLNPDEMNNPDQQSVIDKIQNSSYATLFKQVFGDDIFNNTDMAFDKMAQSIATFEKTTIFNRFTSKFDYFLAGRVSLSAQEQRGLDLFKDGRKSRCTACHVIDTDNGLQPLFTNFIYINLGTPSNPDVLSLKGADFIDDGLGKDKGSAESGKFKVPSLRNVAKTAPYMHNGVFSSLKEVVDFYNTRDIDPKWGAPEVNINVDTGTLGDLGLTNSEVDAIVAFMKTLTDGYELDENAVFISESGSVKLPYVRVETSNQPDSFFAVQMQLVNGKIEVTDLKEISVTDSSLIDSMPYFSFKTDVLEIPVVTEMNNNNPIGTFVAQLKLAPASNGKMVFDIAYLKPLQ